MATPSRLRQRMHATNRALVDPSSSPRRRPATGATDPTVSSWEGRVYKTSRLPLRQGRKRLPDRVPDTARLRAPAAPPPAGDVVIAGPPIPAIKRLEVMSPDEWEQFVLEWADFLRDRYESVERHGGAQDLGCDVIAYLRDGDGAWDNYQCKHYADRLTPSEIWIEIAKLMYHTHRGALTVPRRYVFVAPKGAGTKLAKLLRRPDDLRAGLIEAWENKCRTHIA